MGGGRCGKEYRGGGPAGGIGADIDADIAAGIAVCCRQCWWDSDAAGEWGAGAVGAAGQRTG